MFDERSAETAVNARRYGPTVNNKAAAATTPITVSVDSKIDGGTASTISWTDADDEAVASGSTGTNGDGSATASNLQPGTYTCEVVVDP